MPPNAGVPPACDVKDLSLADAGKRRIEWAFQSMPVLQNIRKQFIRSQALAGVRVGACLPVTAESANLLVTLRDGGAALTVCGLDPRSTQDDAAAALVRDYQVPVFAVRGEAPETCQAHLQAVLDTRPQIVIDDSAELAGPLHAAGQDSLVETVGGTVESGVGAQRLRAMAREGVLAYPVIAAGEAATRQLFDNRIGTGQTAIDGILRATNLLLAGLNFVVGGYGACGRGVAARARGMGAAVIVTEVDPLRALEALMDGHRVMSMSEAAAIADVIVTVTGDKCVVGKEHIEKLRNGVVLCNAGHSNVEIDLECLNRVASSKRPVREFVEEYVLRDGRRVYLLVQGRLVNQEPGEGQPASVMDLCLASQALSVEYLVRQHAALEKRVHRVPEEMDRQVARLKLESLGVKIDRLTLEQEKYLSG